MTGIPQRPSTFTADALSDLRALPVLLRAGFTTPERMAYRRAIRKPGNALTRAECALIVRYYHEAARGYRSASVMLGAYRRRLARLEAGES